MFFYLSNKNLLMASLRHHARDLTPLLHSGGTFPGKFLGSEEDLNKSGTKKILTQCSYVSHYKMFLGSQEAFFLKLALLLTGHVLYVLDLLYPILWDLVPSIITWGLTKMTLKTSSSSRTVNWRHEEK